MLEEKPHIQKLILFTLLQWLRLDDRWSLQELR